MADPALKEHPGVRITLKQWECCGEMYEALYPFAQIGEDHLQALGNAALYGSGSFTIGNNFLASSVKAAEVYRKIGTTVK